jgi:hypothetical protein
VNHLLFSFHHLIHCREQIPYLALYRRDRNVSPMANNGSWSYSNNNHVSLLSTSQQTALPLPKSVNGNRSFANLAKLFGISTSYKDHHTDADEDDDEGEEEVGDAEEAEDAIDEDSLMWDAQVSPLVHLRHPNTHLLHTHNTGTSSLVTRSGVCCKGVSYE